jgi:hypothetical protein
VIRRAAALAAGMSLVLGVPGIATAAAPSGVAPSGVAMVDTSRGLWHVRDAAGATRSFYFGDPGDVPFTGDWDCDGIDTPGLYRRADGFVYLRNSLTQGTADVEFYFGDPGDLPVAGDFDGDGCDSVSLYRPDEARFYVTDRLGAGAAGIGAAERSWFFGDRGDAPLAIDVDGDGTDEVAVHRPGSATFFVRTAAGARAIPYGDPGDVPLAGDWDGDGDETPGVYRASRARFLLGDGTGVADVVLPYGDPAWRAIAGRFGLGGPGDGRGTLVIHAVGDVNLDPDYVPTLGWYGHDYAWSGIGDLFTADDLTIVNLECAPGPGGSAQPKTFVFRCDPAGIAVMAAAGIEVANLANNHSQDHGPDAMVAGRRVVADAGIHPVGAGADLDEALRPAVVDIGGTVVAVLGFGGVVPARSWLAAPGRPGMADGDDIDLMTAAVRDAATRADLVLVTLHWGIERDLTPRPDDVARGRALIDAGADAVFGHHPHRLQPMEIYRGKPIFWSLGNFVWTDHSPAGNVTAVAEVLIQPDGMITAHLIPARIVDDGLVVLVD